jgi:hypothetical protein
VETLLHVYTRSAAGLLLLAALSKIYSTMGSAKILDLPEQLLPLNNRQTLGLVGLIELAIVIIVVLGRSEKVKLMLLAWLSANFILYRLGAALLTVGKPCPCLGSITEKLPLKPATIDHILTAVVLYLFCGSLFFLMALRNRKPAVEPTSERPALAHPNRRKGSVQGRAVVTGI